VLVYVNYETRQADANGRTHEYPWGG